MAKPAKTMTNRRVRGSRTGRPIMVLLDLLGRRWTLRILWELREGALTSRALRSACDEASPTVLNERLKELREAGFVELGNGGGLHPPPPARARAQRNIPAAAPVCGAVVQAELGRRHRQVGAVGLHHPDPAAGRRIGA